jgi:serine phosphatase RsbU (regulator of sigma subunit)
MVPGLRIETAYEPASEVGGDFFQVLPASGNSVFVVVGDVSGKGLRAAMTVSAILGSLRALPASSPAELLQSLNSTLVGKLQGGLVTCLAMRIAASGAVTLANAGHLPPYRNGQELQVETGVPLGILPDMQYQEASLQLPFGDQLTLISDGVVEARNARGELFGFDCTAAISAQSAESIARAAQAFGQEDDITVLTVTRVPAADPVPNCQPEPVASTV